MPEKYIMTGIYCFHPQQGHIVKTKWLWKLQQKIFVSWIKKGWWC